MQILPVLFALFILWPIDAHAGRSSVATDDFNRASLGSNWTQTNPAASNIAILSSIVIYSDAASSATAYWSGTGSFTTNQYSKLKVTGLANLSTGYWIGVACRMSADINSQRDSYVYIVYANGSGTYRTDIGKYVDDVWTQLDTADLTWSVGDTIEIECEGTSPTTIRGYKNGVQQQSTTDSSLSTGKPGVSAAGNSSSVTGDDWEGGNLDSAASDMFFRRRVQ